MTITVNTKTFKVNRIAPDSTTYAGPDNTFSRIDTLAFKRVLPKTGSAGFPGVARPSLKRSRDTVVDVVSGKMAPAILELVGSLPVGMTEAEIEVLVADIVSAAQNATFGLPFYKKLELPTT